MKLVREGNDTGSLLASRQAARNQAEHRQWLRKQAVVNVQEQEKRNMIYEILDAYYIGSYKSKASRGSMMEDFAIELNKECNYMKVKTVYDDFMATDRSNAEAEKAVDRLYPIPKRG